MRNNQIAALLGGGVVLLIALIVIVIAIVIWWSIFSKAGYSGALGLLMLIPIANLIVLLILAFGEWPIQRELRELRARVSQGMAPPGYYTPTQPPPGPYQQR